MTRYEAKEEWVDFINIKEVLALTSGENVMVW